MNNLFEIEYFVQITRGTETNFTITRRKAILIFSIICHSGKDSKDAKQVKEMNVNTMT